MATFISAELCALDATHTVGHVISVICCRRTSVLANTHQPRGGMRWDGSTFAAREICIEDARYRSVRTSVHREGFELWDAPTILCNFADSDAMRSLGIQGPAGTSMRHMRSRESHFRISR